MLVLPTAQQHTAPLGAWSARQACFHPAYVGVAPLRGAQYLPVLIHTSACAHSSVSSPTPYHVGSDPCLHPLPSLWPYARGAGYMWGPVQCMLKSGEESS